MYSESEIDAAVKAGVLSSQAAAEFRAFVARSHAAPGADEEHFRLLSGFNDIFVTIAAALILIALGWLGGQIAAAAGAAMVAAASWGLAEYFTYRRRMALPSILLLFGFVGGVFGVCASLLVPHDGWQHHADSAQFFFIAVSVAVAALAAYLHWRRFMVPVTVAAGSAAVAATVLLLLAAAFPGLEPLLRLASFLAGISIFALAMWWDQSDRQRVTRRSDVAFWLHLAAAPLIVHPSFGALGLLGHGSPDFASAAIAVALYIVLAMVALVADRRALLVSALAYVVFAISALLRGSGSVSFAMAMAALVIGCCLLLLSALWQRARRETVRWLPMAVQARVPPV